MGSGYGAIGLAILICSLYAISDGWLFVREVGK